MIASSGAAPHPQGAPRVLHFEAGPAIAAVLETGFKVKSCSAVEQSLSALRMQNGDQ